MKKNHFGLTKKDRKIATDAEERNRLRRENKLVVKRGKVVKQLLEKYKDNLTKDLSDDQKKTFKLSPNQKKNARVWVQETIEDNPASFGLAPGVFKMVRTDKLYANEKVYQERNKDKF